jgi:eukaryotic-like serine/threonine-protein kinase
MLLVAKIDIGPSFSDWRRQSLEPAVKCGEEFLKIFSMPAIDGPSTGLGTGASTPVGTNPTATAERMRKPLVCFGGFTFDPNGQVLRRGGDELPLPPRVLSVLELLLDRAGDLVPRQELIDSVWKEAFVTDTSLAEAISVLRQALGDDSQSPTYIQTVHRRGYRFVAPVETRSTDAARLLAHPASADLEPATVVPSITGTLVPWSIAVLFGALAFTAVWQLTHQRTAPPPAIARFTITLPPDTRLDDRGPALALAPDGTRMVFSACIGNGCRLYVRPLAQLDANALRGTDDASSPFFSPDGRWIGFFAGGRLKKVAASGGSVATIADAVHPQGAAWTPEGRIVFGSSLAGGLMQVSADGGQPEPLTVPRQELGEVRHAWPGLTADGHALVFTVGTSLDDGTPGRLAIARVDSPNHAPAWSTLLNGAAVARCASSDLLVFSRGAELQAVNFDRARSTISGVPVAVVGPVSDARGYSQFAVSSTGALVYAPRPSSTRDEGLAWWTPNGIVLAPEGTRNASGSVLSADGRSIAWASGVDADRSDIWVADLQRGAITRLTHDGLNVSPAWSPDGRRIYFARRDTGVFHMMAVMADGGSSTPLPAADRHAFPFSVSPDGGTIAFVQIAAATRADIWTVPVNGAGATRPLVQTPFDETSPAFSSTGLVAYQSDESGRWEVYAHRLRDGKRIVISTSGGERPFWSHDGRALFYQSGTRVMKVSIADDLAVTSPGLVLDMPHATVIGVAPDGRFLIERRSSPASTAIVALEWAREVRELLGPPAARLPR